MESMNLSFCKNFLLNNINHLDKSKFKMFKFRLK